MRKHDRSATWICVIVAAAPWSCVIAGCGAAVAQGDDDGQADAEGLEGAGDVEADGPQEIAIDDAGDTDGGGRCGDGVVDPGEECDTGPNISDVEPDACRTTCVWAYCGDAVVDTGEACDDGNAIETDECLSTCAAAACGDGHLWTGMEECEGGSPRACATGCGSTGTEECRSCVWSRVCVPPAEVCNGRDDDCANGPDDTFVCVMESTQPCTVGACSGMRACVAPACAWGACEIPPPPANDDCGGSAAEIGAGGTFSGTTCSAADDFSGSCGGAGAPDVVYALTLTTRATVVLDSTGSSFDTVLVLLAGAACPGTETECDDDGAGGASRIVRTLDPGAYWVVVDGAAPDATGDFRLAVTVTGPPPNDVCAGAIDVGAGGVFVGSNFGAANDYSGGCGDSAGADVVYTFTITGGRDVFITTVGSDYDTVVYLRSGSCTSGNVDCQDDYRAPVSDDGILIRDNLAAGTYYVIVDAKSAADLGDFRLEVNINADKDPGDSCGEPWELAPGTTQHCERTNGRDSDYVGSCAGGNRRDTVYYFVVPERRTVSFDTCDSGTAFDTVLYLRSACTDAASEIACNNDDATCIGAPTRSRASVAVDPGIYYVFVDSRRADGNYCLNTNF